MNRDQLEGAWEELKGKVQKRWGKLTEDEVNQTKGRFKELSGVLQRKYGLTKEKADHEIDDFLKKSSSGK